MKKLILLLPLLFGLSSCTSTGDPDWELIGDSVELASHDIRDIADLSIAGDVRDELIEISAALEAVAPYIAIGEGGVNVVELLDTADALILVLLAREDLNDTVRDSLVVLQLALNHARPHFVPES